MKGRISLVVLAVSASASPSFAFGTQKEYALLPPLWELIGELDLKCHPIRMMPSLACGLTVAAGVQSEFRFEPDRARADLSPAGW